MNIPHSHHAQVMKMKFTYCSVPVHGHSTDARAFCTAVSHAVLHGGQLYIQMSIFLVYPSWSMSFLCDWTNLSARSWNRKPEIS